jgi:hypothetical protein
MVRPNLPVPSSTLLARFLSMNSAFMTRMNVSSPAGPENVTRQPGAAIRLISSMVTRWIGLLRMQILLTDFGSIPTLGLRGSSVHGFVLPPLSLQNGILVE